MNILEITRMRFNQTEFVVDGTGLGMRFEFEDQRPFFGRTCFDWDDKLQDNRVLQLRGLLPPDNQFGTNRFVLYGCHCGCDYCGVISCRIRRDEHTLSWEDIRFETDEEGWNCEEDNDPDDKPIELGMIDELTFDLDHYDRAIARHLELCRHGSGYRVEILRAFF